MQQAKDTFYIALRTRLAAVNPQRTITLEGTAQPAILVAQNEVETAAQEHAECFYLRFGESRIAQGFERSTSPLMRVDCVITYRTSGSAEGGAGRGRAMGALDGELMAICKPASAPKLDYTQQAPASLGTRVFWTQPQLGELTEGAGELSRTASTTIFFYPEEATA